ncbi:MAG: hypothetical protein Q9M25_09015 [Mariprofundaceae bacterium]|nr:hypothetical protein [Mariprofundaceae bacterium]
MVKKIRQGRNTKADKFVSHFNEPIAKYSVQQALWDVIQYHQTCSFMYGLRKALEEGEKPAISSQIAKVESRIEKMTIKKDLRRDKVITDNAGKTNSDVLDYKDDPTFKLYEAEIKAAETRLNGLNTLEVSK